LVTALSNVQTEELKKDTTKDAETIYLTAVDLVANAKTDATSIVQQPALDKKRESLNALTDNLRNLFITVKYDRAKIYYQECPTAFGDNKPGNWLSKLKDVRNPYLGNKHPEFKDKMLTCGEPKDTINFVPVDTPTSSAQPSSHK
jgi:Cu(I)/Ag(I) efflux system membrane fusion protein